LIHEKGRGEERAPERSFALRRNARPKKKGEDNSIFFSCSRGKRRSPSIVRGGRKQLEEKKMGVGASYEGGG